MRHSICELEIVQNSNIIQFVLSLFQCLNCTYCPVSRRLYHFMPYLTLPKFWAVIQHIHYAEGKKCMLLAEYAFKKITVAHHCRHTEEMTKKHASHLFRMHQKSKTYQQSCIKAPQKLIYRRSPVPGAVDDLWLWSDLCVYNVQVPSEVPAPTHPSRSIARRLKCSHKPQMTHMPPVPALNGSLLSLHFFSFKSFISALACN